MRIGSPQNHNGDGLITGISAINSASTILSDATVLENGSNVTLSNHDGAIVINAELGALEQKVSSKINKPLVNGSNGWVLALNEDGTTSWVDNGFTEITWNDIQSKPATINVLPQSAGSNNQYFVMQNGVATWRHFDGSVIANSPLAPAGSAVHAFLNSHISTIALHVPQSGNISDVLMKTPGGVAFMPLPQNADTATMADSALYASSAGKLASSVNIGNAPFDGTANVTIQQIGAANSVHSHSNDAWFSNALVSKMTIPLNPTSGKVLAVDETGSGFEWIYVNVADSATYASSAGSAISAGYAISAGIATSANYASSAGNVGNGVITLQIDGASVGSFSMNQSADSTINITGGSIDSSVLESYANGIEMSLNNNTISTVLKNGNTSLGNVQTVNLPLDNLVSNTRTVNGKALSSDVVIYGSDILDSANGSNLNAIFDGISQQVSSHVNNSSVHVPEFDTQNNGHVLSVSGGTLSWTSTVVVDSMAVLPHFDTTDSGKALMVNESGNGIEWGIVSGGGTVGSGVITMQAGGTSIGSFNVNTSNDTSINIPVATNDSYGVVKIETVVSNTSNAVANSVVYSIGMSFDSHVSDSTVHVPSGGSNGQVLKMVSGSLAWGTDLTADGSTALPSHGAGDSGLALIVSDGNDVVWGVPVSATYAGTAIELSHPITIGNATVNVGSSVTVSDVGAASAVHSHVVSEIVGFDGAVSAIIGNGGSGDAYPNRLFVIGDTRTNNGRCNGTYYRIASTYDNLPVYCKDSNVIDLNYTGSGYIMYLTGKWRIIDDFDMYDTPGYYYYLSDNLTGFYYNGNYYYNFNSSDWEHVTDNSNPALSNLFVSETDFSILSNYYMKNEIDSRFNSIDMTNYYTKSEIDSMMSSNIGNIESALSAI